MLHQAKIARDLLRDKKYYTVVARNLCGVQATSSIRLTRLRMHNDGINPYITSKPIFDRESKSGDILKAFPIGFFLIPVPNVPYPCRLSCNPPLS